MPRQITQIRVFIGSPGGLGAERGIFRDLVERTNTAHAEARGIQFKPVGWEDTVGGAGRPQALINSDLESCDYAVFVLHDRWGSETGTHTSGFHEEWELAQKLYDEKKLWNLILLFKDVDPAKLADPGKQLEQVLAFRDDITKGRKHLYKCFGRNGDFERVLESTLADWLRDGEQRRDSGALVFNGAASPFLSARSSASVSDRIEPGFDFWIAEMEKLEVEEPSNHAGVILFAKRAAGVAKNDLEWAMAAKAYGQALISMKIYGEAEKLFDQILTKIDNGSKLQGRPGDIIAECHFSTGYLLEKIGRNDESIKVYRALLDRVDDKSDDLIRLSAASSLLNMIFVYQRIGNSGARERIARELIDRFGGDDSIAIRKIVDRARNK